MKRATDGSGRRWAIGKRYDIPDLLDRSRVYLRRRRLIQTPWFGVYLHAIHLPDRDRHLHDHPWPFASLILRGGYDEEFCRTRAAALAQARAHADWPDEFAIGALRKTWRAGSFHRMPLHAFHAITSLHRTPTWTLVLVGRRQHEWGYATPNGWERHDSYHHGRNAEHPLAAS